MNLEKFTIKTQSVIMAAQELATSNNNQFIEDVHLVKAMLNEEAVIPYLFKKCEVNVDLLKKVVDKEYQSLPKVSGGSGVYFSQTMAGIFQSIDKILAEYGDEYVSLDHLLLAVVRSKGKCSQILKDAGLQET
ncbi:MAG: hypothetical protein J6Y47_01075 [Bacteroidales bacterium]|nr:hypothetical protein [Bacteroidales bacterium]